MQQWEFATAGFYRAPTNGQLIHFWREYASDEPLNFGSTLELTRHLAAAGRDGWEMVSASSSLDLGESYFFKRPLAAQLD